MREILCDNAYLIPSWNGTYGTQMKYLNCVNEIYSGYGMKRDDVT